MQLAKAFERLVLARVEQLPRSPRGRPLKLADADALAFLFKVLRTGMQWREVRNTELDASFWLYGPDGNHCPFLNTEPTRSAFFQSLAAWMTAVQLASAA